MKSLNICYNQWWLRSFRWNLVYADLLWEENTVRSLKSTTEVIHAISKRKKRAFYCKISLSHCTVTTHGIPIWINRCYCRGAVQCQSTNNLNWQRSLVPFACVEWTALAVYLFPRTTENHFLTHNSKRKCSRSMMCAEENKASGHRGAGRPFWTHKILFFCLYGFSPLNTMLIYKPAHQHRRAWSKDSFFFYMVTV
jgi:hypothetical protein